MIGFEEAARRLNVLARPLGTERVRLEAAGGRVLAAPVVARISSPAATVSAMDGYAVRDADLRSAPVRLRVLGESFAGAAYAGAVSPGGCVRIFTGAPAPAGADRVIIQELVRREGDQAIVPEPPPGRRHLRAAASDFSAGEVLVEAGAALNPQRLVAAAAADLSHVDVVRRPRVTILCTGDELRPPGQAGAAGSIPDSVSLGVAAMARDWGAEVFALRRLGDDLHGLERAAAEAVEGSDLVVVTGGASVGARDFAKAMFEPLGLDLVFPKVAIKPGKPVWFGQAADRLVLGLPGNPTAALLTARLFLAPLICGLSGRGTRAAWSWRRAPLAGPLEGCGDRETFYRARAAGEAVAPLADQDSSAQKALAASDVVIRRQRGEGKAEAGERVSVLDF